MTTRYSLPYLTSSIEGQNGTSCNKILEDNQDLFRKAMGSSHNHQNWEGGYWDHIEEVMNLAYVLYPTLNNLRPLPFSLSDALLVLFLHDLEKPWKYELDDNGELKSRLDPNLSKKELKQQAQLFRDNKLAEYGISLSERQLNGFRYVEGEHNDYSSKYRVMNELAAFCHMCDVV